MTESIVDVGSRHVGEIKVINRELTEKALHMRCLSYLSHVKAGLLTETIYEIDESKKVLLDVNKQLLQQKKIIEYQNRLLSEKNMELKSFSHSVSHDLRGSLRRIDGFTKILLTDCKDQLNEEATGYLLRIVENSQNLGQMIDSLMRLAKLSHNQLMLQTVNLSELAANIINQLKKNEPERQVEIDIKSEMIVKGDKSLLELALKNLIKNAWKFTGKTPQAIIEFGEQEIDGKRTFYIKDNGAGFNAQYKDKLFKEFSRLHNKEQFEGTGIGLAIVYRIISRHGGEIWAEGQEKHGATFYFRLHDDLESFLKLSEIAAGNHDHQVSVDSSQCETTDGT